VTENNGQFKQTHGIKAFEDRGEKALTPERHLYLKELKARLATSEGRKEARVDLAAAIALICELGFSQLREDVEAGKDIWSGGVIKILGSYQNTLQRMLATWPADEEKPKNIIDALRGDNEQAG
jgi:hypothetical protein